MRMTGLRLIGLTTIDLPLHGVQPSDPYILKGATGLGPVEMDVFIARGEFRKRVLREREIVVRMGLNPNWSVGQTAADLRDVVYGLLGGGFNTPELIVQIVDGATVVAQTKGVVRLPEMNAFSKETEVQLTIACLTAEWTGVAEVSLEDFGATSTPTVTYEGGLPAGFRAAFTLGAFGDQFSLYVGDPDRNKITFDFAGEDESLSFAAGWTAVIDTRPGQRYAWMSSGVFPTGYSMLPFMTADSVWPVLLPGENEIVVSEFVQEWPEFKYTPQYWGI